MCHAPCENAYSAAEPGLAGQADPERKIAAHIATTAGEHERIGAVGLRGRQTVLAVNAIAAAKP